MNDIKASLARIFIAVINADGIVSMKELGYLEKELNPKYQLLPDDFEKSKQMTFAEAVKVIKSEADNSYFDKFKNKILTVAEDMENLSRVDGDIHIHPREALLCLAFRLAVDTDYCEVISCHNNSLRFSKSDILYVNTEKEQDSYFNAVINRNYYAIQYMLQSFGFNFVFIPKMMETFLGYSDEYLEEIIRHFYPDTKEIEATRDSIKYHLKEADTIDFTKNMFYGGESIIPSVLIKIGSTQNRNRDGLTDFILLNVDHEGVLKPLQEFLFKYDDLCEKNNLIVHRGRQNNEFQVKSFHRTYFEYLMQMARKIIIKVDVLKKKMTIEFGNVGEIKLSRAEAKAFYITLLYYSIKREPFTKNWQHEERMVEQKMVFDRIYDKLKNRTNNSKNDFYIDRYQILYGKITEAFKNTSNAYIQSFMPQYDEEKQEIVTPFAFIKLLVTNERYKEKTLDNKGFIGWVNGLLH